MTNAIILIVILIPCGIMAFVAYKMHQLQKNEILKISDEIVKSIVEVGGTVDQIKNISTRQNQKLAVFHVNFYDATGEYQKREVAQRLSAQGWSTGPLLWDQPLHKAADQISNLKPLENKS